MASVSASVSTSYSADSPAKSQPSNDADLKDLRAKLKSAEDKLASGVLCAGEVGVGWGKVTMEFTLLATLSMFEPAVVTVLIAPPMARRGAIGGERLGKVLYGHVMRRAGMGNVNDYQSFWAFG